MKYLGKPYPFRRDGEERVQIESHVVHTYKFLEQIPWTTELRGIPAIARGHHEKLNGRGYPYKLAAVTASAHRGVAPAILPSSIQRTR